MEYIMNRMKKEEAASVNTAAATCWSKNDAEIIRNKVNSAGGFAPLDNMIRLFREESFSQVKDMFENFVEWNTKFKRSDNPAECNKFIADAIEKATMFVCIQCIVPLLEAGGDGFGIGYFVDEAVKIIDHFQSDAFQFSGDHPPPP